MRFITTILLFLSIFTSCQRPTGTTEEKAAPIWDSCLLLSLQLQTGDLVFRRGIGFESNVVTAADKGAAYSHVGMLMECDNRWMVLHAVPGEEHETAGKQVLKLDALSRFLAPDRCVKAGIFRYADDEDGQLRNGMEHNEKEHNNEKERNGENARCEKDRCKETRCEEARCEEARCKETRCEEARRTLKQQGLRLYEKGLLFDHSYSLSDTDRMYCTELVCYLYQFIGVDLAEGRSHRFPMLKEPIVYPIDLTRNPKLHIVWQSR